MGTAAKRQEFSIALTEDEAVELYKLVALSDFTNGLGEVYVALGDLVRDENGNVPMSTEYARPSWA